MFAKPPRAPALLPDGQITSDFAVHPPGEKYSASQEDQISGLCTASRLFGGALAIVTNVGRDVVDADGAARDVQLHARGRTALEADGEVVWS
jgi:hypothetical protein